MTPSQLVAQIEQDYFELGPRIANWWTLGFGWGDGRDRPWSAAVGQELIEALRRAERSADWHVPVLIVEASR